MDNNTHAICMIRRYAVMAIAKGGQVNKTHPPFLYLLFVILFIYYFIYFFAKNLVLLMYEVLLNSLHFLVFEFLLKASW